MWYHIVGELDSQQAEMILSGAFLKKNPTQSASFPLSFYIIYCLSALHLLPSVWCSIPDSRLSQYLQGGYWGLLLLLFRLEEEEEEEEQ